MKRMFVYPSVNIKPRTTVPWEPIDRKPSPLERRRPDLGLQIELIA